MKRLIFSAMVITLQPAFAADPLTGRVTVIDGDTIEIAGERIRFNGINAPETRQSCQDASGADYRCGTISANALSEWLEQSQPTTCITSGKDRYKRWIAACFRADGADVQGWLVRSGYALDYPKYSKGRYAADQAEAEGNDAGMWAGEFIEPWNFRRGKR